LKRGDSGIEILGELVRVAVVQLAAVSWPVAPPPITKTSLVIGSLISTGRCGADLGFLYVSKQKAHKIYKAVNIRGRPT
jgi:hypothetical protein